MIVYTACFGGFDSFQPQAPQDIAVDWYAFTDNQDAEVPEPWKAIVVPGKYDVPRMSAKWYKLQPHRIEEFTGTRDVVWIDANMQITEPSFAAGALASRRNGFAAWRHPERDCIYEEAVVSVRLSKYTRRVIHQVEHYRAEGHPQHGGLFACGTLAWDTSQRRVNQLGDAWLAECEAWTYQDQLSLPVVCRRMNFQPGVFPLDQLGRRVAQPWIENDWLRIHRHRSNR